MIFYKVSSLLLLVSLFVFPFDGKGQNIVLKRLKKVEQNHPEKLESKAKKYSNIFSNKPQAYYFLSKDQMSKFENEQDDKKKFKKVLACVRYARKSQDRLEDSKFKENQDWLAHRNEIRNEVYFYLQERAYSDNRSRLQEQYYLFMSYGERRYLMDHELKIQFPEDQKVDTLYYGLPTGKEIVIARFLEEEQKMLDMINAERKKLNMPVVEIDSSLSAACRYHAFDMGTQKYVGHAGRDLGNDGRDYFANHTFDRIRQFYSLSRVLNENISWGNKEAYFTYKRWFKSSAHYKNLFNPENNKVGIGLVHVPNSEYKYYWVFNAAK